jgi:hypothetical protein
VSGSDRSWLVTFLRSKPVVFLALFVLAALLRVTDANPAMAQNQSIGAWSVSAAPPMDGSSPDWQSILPVFLPTTSQQVEPPMGGGSIERIAVRAVHYQEHLYVMMEWADRSEDDSTESHEAFTDAAAIQLPAEAGSEVPAICMGQADQAVNIWHWRADQQGEPPAALGEHGYVDSYPSTDDLYFPAREAGNPLSRAAGRAAVSNLVAGGFGTLEISDQGGLDGHAVHKDGRWMVVFARPFAASGELQPTIGGRAIDIAFAVWDGSRGERDGIKSVSSFTQLRVTPDEPPRRAVAATEDWPAYSPTNPMLLVSYGFIGLLLIGTLFLWRYMRREESGRDDARTP